MCGHGHAGLLNIVFFELLPSLTILCSGRPEHESITRQRCIHYALEKRNLYHLSNASWGDLLGVILGASTRAHYETILHRHAWPYGPPISMTCGVAIQPIPECQPSANASCVVLLIQSTQGSFASHSMLNSSPIQSLDGL